MQDNEQEIQEFSLDEILKEFGDPAAETDEVVPVSEEAPAEEAAQPEPQASAAGDTIRLDDTVRLDDTMKLDSLAEAVPEKKASSVSDDTAVFAPIPEAVFSEDEPLPEGWEQPFDETNMPPREPIVFRPKSRLKELKRKLIAGPEKRYYELAETGVGKLQVSIFLNLLLVLLVAGSAGLYALDLVQPERMRLLIFGQFFLMLLSATLGCYRLLDGIGDLFTGKFSLNTLLVFTFAACVGDCILCLQTKQVPYCAPFCLEMTMSLWAAYERRVAEMGQMDTMRKATRLDSLVKFPGYYDDRPGFLRGEGSVEDFMEHYEEKSGPEKVLNVYAVLALLSSVGIGVWAAYMDGWNWQQGLRLGTAAILMSLPVTSFITHTRPMAILEKRLHKLGTVLCGWTGVKGLCGAAVFPLRDEDLFPAGSAKMNGVKFYGDRSPDEVVAYGSAVIAADGGVLSPLFEQLLESRGGAHYPVENLVSYGNGGVGGEVNGESVLVGVLSFFKDMGVEMPEGTRVNQAVYVAIDGQLCGVFAISYSKSKTAAAGLSTLCGYRRLTPVLTDSDFMLTESFIRSKFGVNTRRVAFPDREVRTELSACEADPESPVLAMATQPGLAPMAYAVTGARALRTSHILGTVLHMIGGILGLAIVGVLLYLGATELITPANLLLFELVWMVPGLLITEWTRAI